MEVFILSKEELLQDRPIALIKEKEMQLPILF